MHQPVPTSRRRLMLAAMGNGGHQSADELIHPSPCSTGGQQEILGQWGARPSVLQKENKKYCIQSILLCTGHPHQISASPGEGTYEVWLEFSYFWWRSSQVEKRCILAGDGGGRGLIWRFTRLSGHGACANTLGTLPVMLFAMKHEKRPVVQEGVNGDNVEQNWTRFIVLITIFNYRFKSKCQYTSI